jgi:hypothetical protein
MVILLVPFLDKTVLVFGVAGAFFAFFGVADVFLALLGAAGAFFAIFMIIGCFFSSLFDPIMDASYIAARL